MKIVAIHDSEDVNLDPIEPLGDILIEDDDGSQLLERSIWVDEWFTALIAGLHAIISGEKEITTKMESHREPLVWKAETSVFTVTHKKIQIVIRDLSAFDTLLKETIVDFTSNYVRHHNLPKSKHLLSAREWAQPECD
jgi:hypothetical protein